MQPSNQLPKEHHEYVPPKPAADPNAQTGYVVKDYEHQEYPKMVGSTLCQNADEENALLAKQPVVLDWEAAEKQKAADRADAEAFVVSRGYTADRAKQIVDSYGVEHILASRKDAELEADGAAELPAPPANSNLPIPPVPQAPTPAPAQPGPALVPAPASDAAADPTAAH